jgi:sporulation protein YlmC with PRC-barrel domain
MYSSRLLTVGTCCLALLVAHATAQQQPPRTPDRQAEGTEQQTQQRTEQATGEAQRAEELERQAKEKAEQAKQLAEQAKQLAEQAKQLSRQASELRGQPYEEDSTWSLFGESQHRTRTEPRTRADQRPRTDRGTAQTQLKLDDVIGMTVNGSDGEKLGTIKDIVLDPQSGEIRYVALSHGGLLGIGDKLVAVTWDDLRTNWQQEDEEYVVVVNKTKQSLENAPGFDQNAWPHHADASSQQAERDPATGQETRESRAFRAGQERREGQPEQQTQTQTRTDQGEPLKGSDVLGMTVKNEQNEDLGTIKDAVIDQQAGKIRYAALSFGGWLGIGDKLFAVPWRALTIQQGENDDRFVLLKKSKQDLERAPGFPDDNWPDATNVRFQREVNTFYGTSQQDTQREDTRRQTIRPQRTPGDQPTPDPQPAPTPDPQPAPRQDGPENEENPPRRN